MGIVTATLDQIVMLVESGALPQNVNYAVKSDYVLPLIRDVAGARVDERVEDFEYGRFGWAWDPEGNRFELWQPLGPGF